MHALEAPLLKLTVVAAGALAVAAFVPHHHHPRTVHRLVLHAPAQPLAYYVSVWADGNDVRLELDPHHLQAMQFETIEDLTDGCRWLGTETLIPDGNHYDYRYDETILSCSPHPLATIKTPRSGTVTIE